MKEIASKKAPTKTILEKGTIHRTKKSYKCDCGCIGTSNEDNYDGGFDAAFNDGDPACGCGCGGTQDVDQTLDIAYED